MKDLHAMTLWAEQAPEELRVEVTKMWKSKVKAKKRSATITPKRTKRRDVTEDRSDGGEESEEKNNSGGVSDFDEGRNSRRPTTRRARRKIAAVTPSAGAARAHTKASSVGTELDAIVEEQLVEENLIMDMAMPGTKTKTNTAHIQEYNN